jgi:hypothetical protein
MRKGSGGAAQEMARHTVNFFSHSFSFYFLPLTFNFSISLFIARDLCFDIEMKTFVFN